MIKRYFFFFFCFYGAAFSSHIPSNFFTDEHDFSVVSCSPDSVIVTGDDSFSIKPGQLLLYINTDSKDESESNCDGCNILFRKVVSRDGNTLTTSLIRFDEVFPINTEITNHDHDFASESMKKYKDLFIEPLIGCEYSTSYSTNSSIDRHYRRQLQNETGTVTASTTDICDIIGYIILPLIIISLCVVPLVIPLCFLVIGQAILTWILTATGQCDNPVEDIDIWAPELWTEESDASFSIVSDFYNRNLNSDAIKRFPVNCVDWMKTDYNGKCLYSECHPLSLIGDERKSTECFFNSNIDFCSSRHDNFQNGIISEEIVESIGFKNALSMKNMCYSSNYMRETCDANFYRAMINTCVVAHPKLNDIVFPMSSSTLHENCYLMSIFFFIRSKILGESKFKFLQLEQKRYQEKGCGSASGII